MELIEQLKESGCTYSLVKQLAKFTVGIRSYDFKKYWKEYMYWQTGLSIIKPQVSALITIGWRKY